MVPLRLLDPPNKVAENWTYYEGGWGVSDDGKHSISRADDRTWTVVAADGSRVAEATTLALHPTTIVEGEWSVKRRRAWHHHSMHFAHTPINTSPTRPISLDLLGRDFFMRHRTSSLIWYIDPTSGCTVHSGSKAHEGKTGVRFCARCNLSISANNFVHQHMRKMHANDPRPGQSGMDKVRECIGEI